MLPKYRRWMPWMTHWRRWAVGEARHAMHPVSVYSLIRLHKGTSQCRLGFLQLRGSMSQWKNMLSVRGTQRSLGEESCFSQIPSVCLINHLENKIENRTRILTSDWQNFTLPTQIFLRNTGMFLLKDSLCIRNSTVFDLPLHYHIPERKYFIWGKGGWGRFAQFRAGGRLDTGWV